VLYGYQSVRNPVLIDDGAGQKMDLSKIRS